MEGILHEDVDVYDNTSLNYFSNENYFRQKLWRKSKYTLYVR